MLDLLPRNTMLRINKVLMFQTVKPMVRLGCLAQYANERPRRRSHWITQGFH